MKIGQEVTVARCNNLDLSEATEIKGFIHIRRTNDDKNPLSGGRISMARRSDNNALYIQFECELPDAITMLHESLKALEAIHKIYNPDPL
jgi:hypothetical protein